MSGDRTSGRKPGITDEEVLAALHTTREPVLTTVEVAAELPIGRRATLDRLENLREAGRLEGKTVGPRGEVWWLAAAERPSDAELAEDPFLTAPTDASGRSDVSADVDDALAEATSAEVDPDA